MERSTILLPELLATMSSASRIGTPDDRSVPSVRVKRAITIFRSTLPTMGALRMIRSKWKRVFSFARMNFRPEDMPKAAPAYRYQYFRNPFDMLMTNWVGAGRPPPLEN